MKYYWLIWWELKEFACILKDFLKDLYIRGYFLRELYQNLPYFLQKYIYRLSSISLSTVGNKKSESGIMATSVEQCSCPIVCIYYDFL